MSYTGDALAENESARGKVAVIIPAYNASATIARAISSALSEPEVSEVMVIDDASQDGTLTAAREADDGTGRLKILLQQSNAGPAAARNLAIRESRAPWIGILDSDDFFLPGRLRSLLSFTRDGFEPDFIADNLWQVKEGDINKPNLRPLIEESEPKFISFSEFVCGNISRRGRDRRELGFLKPLMRRAFLDRHGLRYQEHMRLGEDYELYARALALGARFALVPAQGYVSVVRDNSLSSCHSEEDLLHLRDSTQMLAALPGLGAAERKALRRHFLSVDCRLQWRLLILAVKQRNPAACLATFLRPLPVPFYLAVQLAEQGVIRLGRRLRPATAGLEDKT